MSRSYVEEFKYFQSIRIKDLEKLLTELSYNIKSRKRY